MKSQTEMPLQIVFCGQPCTLKTFLSSRVAHSLGALWLPTVAIATITTQPGPELAAQRADRYARCIDALRALAGMRARVVVEGGFPTLAIKQQLFATYPDCPKILIECSATPETRLARLKNRANNPHDIEQASAASIVENWQTEPAQAASPVVPATPEEVTCSAIIRVNTSDFSINIEGTLDAALSERLFSALQSAFDEFRATDKSHAREQIKQNFNELAPLYEESTEWRTDATLLAQLQVDLPHPACEVLDIGSGTGLAAEWYTAQGHRCIGVDLSPKMSVRAASRMLFTNFGSAIDLPFFDAAFDLALMRQMLHYTEPALALQEAQRVLRPGGKLVISAAIAPANNLRPVWEEFKNVTQPLRLRVFTEADLAELLHEAGFDIIERRHASLTRCESFTQLAQRAREPASGWQDFLNMMARIFAKLAPELEFVVTEDGFSYRQFWVTLISQKETGATP